MLCHDLTSIFPHRALVVGSRMHEPKFRPECTISAPWLDIMHSGKDESIIHMLSGGNGFPQNQFGNYSSQNAFDMGCTEKRRDLRSMSVWASDLRQALTDRKMGRVR